MFTVSWFADNSGLLNLEIRGILVPFMWLVIKYIITSLCNKNAQNKKTKKFHTHFVCVSAAWRVDISCWLFNWQWTGFNFYSWICFCCVLAWYSVACDLKILLFEGKSCDDGDTSFHVQILFSYADLMSF